MEHVEKLLEDQYGHQSLATAMFKTFFTSVDAIIRTLPNFFLVN